VEAASSVLSLGVWELVGRLSAFSFIPPFSAVVEAWLEIAANGVLLGELLASLRALAVGFGLAVVCGLGLGLLMGWSERAAYFFDPLVDINLATPNLVYLPVLFALFGAGDGTRYALVFLYAVFTLALNAKNGVRAADARLVEMGRAFGANNWQVFRLVTLPAASPLIFAGLRVGINQAVKGMVNGEMFIALVGLGARLRIYGGTFNFVRLYAVILTVVALALVLAGCVQALERRLAGWAERAA
jgi:NitT/TauT family transport system permease protein